MRISSWDPAPGPPPSTEISKSLFLPHERERLKKPKKYPLHEAIYKGNVREMEKLIETMGVDDLQEKTMKGRTPLHYACHFMYQKTALEMVNAIIDKIDEHDPSYDGVIVRNVIESQDSNGDTCLHIAAKRGHTKVVDSLLDFTPKTSIRDNKEKQALELIYRNVPGAVCKILDNAIKLGDGDPYDDTLEVCFDFGCIVGTPNATQDAFFEKETNFLSQALNHSGKNKKDILLHPLVQLFLHLKWRKFSGFIYLSMMYHIAWMLLYTASIVDLYMVQCPYESGSGIEDTEAHANSMNRLVITNTIINENKSKTGTIETDGSFTCGIDDSDVSSIRVVVGILYAITGTMILKELFEISATEVRSQYFKQLENIGQWLLMIIVVITTMPIFNDVVIIVHSWQYQMSAIGIILAWSLILSQIGSIPSLSVYIEILVKVLGTYIKIMITFISLLVAFKFSFQILLPENEEFRSFPWGFIKMLDMMIGEVNYSDLFYSEDGESAVPFPILTKLLILTFVSVITIVLFNLLIGFTVTDIEELRSSVEYRSLSKQIININLMEQFYISESVQSWLRWFNQHTVLRTFLVCQQTSTSSTSLKIPIVQIPPQLQDDIVRIVVENLETPDEKDDFNTEKDFDDYERNFEDISEEEDYYDDSTVSAEVPEHFSTTNSIDHRVPTELNEIREMLSEILEKLGNSKK